uniref:Uncharacterized protein n=1 Tax=viral metagenome TaxID=1070528 RepID=A0A6C0JQU7_9ZZZZ
MFVTGEIYNSFKNIKGERQAFHHFQVLDNKVPTMISQNGTNYFIDADHNLLSANVTTFYSPDGKPENVYTPGTVIAPLFDVVRVAGGSGTIENNEKQIITEKITEKQTIITNNEKVTEKQPKIGIMSSLKIGGVYTVDFVGSMGGQVIILAEDKLTWLVGKNNHVERYFDLHGVLYIDKEKTRESGFAIKSLSFLKMDKETVISTPELEEKIPFMNSLLIRGVYKAKFDKHSLSDEVLILDSDKLMWTYIGVRYFDVYGTLYSDAEKKYASGYVIKSLEFLKMNETIVEKESNEQKIVITDVKVGGLYDVIFEHGQTCRVEVVEQDKFDMGNIRYRFDKYGHLFCDNVKQKICIVSFQFVKMAHEEIMKDVQIGQVYTLSFSDGSIHKCKIVEKDVYTYMGNPHISRSFDLDGTVYWDKTRNGSCGVKIVKIMEEDTDPKIMKDVVVGKTYNFTFNDGAVEKRKITSYTEYLNVNADQSFGYDIYGSVYTDGKLTQKLPSLKIVEVEQVLDNLPTLVDPVERPVVVAQRIINDLRIGGIYKIGFTDFDKECKLLSKNHFQYACQGLFRWFDDNDNLYREPEMRNKVNEVVVTSWTFLHMDNDEKEAVKQETNVQNVVVVKQETNVENVVVVKQENIQQTTRKRVFEDQRVGGIYELMFVDNQIFQCKLIEQDHFKYINNRNKERWINEELFENYNIYADKECTDVIDNKVVSWKFLRMAEDEHTQKDVVVPLSQQKDVQWQRYEVTLKCGKKYSKKWFVASDTEITTDVGEFVEKFVTKPIQKKTILAKLANGKKFTMLVRNVPKKTYTIFYRGNDGYSVKHFSTAFTIPEKYWQLTDNLCQVVDNIVNIVKDVANIREMLSKTADYIERGEKKGFSMTEFNNISDQLGKHHENITDHEEKIAEYEAKISQERQKIAKEQEKLDEITFDNPLYVSFERFYDACLDGSASDKEFSDVPLFIGKMVLASLKEHAKITFFQERIRFNDAVALCKSLM